MSRAGGWPAGRWLLVAGLARLAWPTAAAALEPRYDHRDQQGLLAELEAASDSVVTGGLAHGNERLVLRVAWGYDLSGEGDELQLGGTAKLGPWTDPRRERRLYGLDARYRAYFGSEELKTFVEIGLWGDIASRAAVGALAGLGLEFDPSRRWGLFAAARFAGGYGEARVASVSLAAGAQVRW